jgi:MFS family permease
MPASKISFVFSPFHFILIIPAGGSRPPRSRNRTPKEVFMPVQVESPGAFHPSERPYRFTVLAFVALLTFGSYFAYDIIGAVAPSLIEQLGASRGTIGTLYTMYSVAAILSVLIGGVLIDRLGTRVASMIFSVLVLAGSVIVAYANSIPMLFLGRFVFGAGSEPLIVAQMAMVSRWFKGKEMALAFGVTLTVSRLGTLFSFNTGELISQRYGGVHASLMASVGFCLLSLLANGIYVLMDRRGERILGLKSGHAGDRIVLKDIRSFGPGFWYVTLLCVTFYSAIFPFTALSTDFFVDKWGVARVAESGGGFFRQVFGNFLHMTRTAGGISSIIIFASMVCAPFAGHLVDRIGKRASLMIVGSLILIPSHLIMGVTRIYPVAPMILLGAAFVLIPAAMWPSIPLLVKKETEGTAFGLMTMVQNIGLALFPALNGALRDATRSYTASQIMFSVLGVIGLAFSLLLKRADRDHGRVLENP